MLTISVGMVVVSSNSIIAQRAKSTAPSIKLMATNTMGSDETIVRFGASATTQFDSNIDMYKTGTNSYVPTISSETEGVVYSINSLPPITEETSVNINVEIPSTGTYHIYAKEVMNFEKYEAINLYDIQTKTTQNLLTNNDYIFEGTVGDNKQRFILTFKLSPISTITNLEDNTLNSSSIKISSNGINQVNIISKGYIAKDASVIISSIIGHRVYSNDLSQLSDGSNTITVDNLKAGIYVVNTTIDGRTYAKEVFLGQ